VDAPDLRAGVERVVPCAAAPSPVKPAIVPGWVNFLQVPLPSPSARRPPSSVSLLR
jgi:hypothetical protein